MFFYTDSQYCEYKCSYYFSEVQDIVSPLLRSRLRSLLCFRGVCRSCSGYEDTDNMDDTSDLSTVLRPSPCRVEDCDLERDLDFDLDLEPLRFFLIFFRPLSVVLLVVFLGVVAF